MGTFWVRSAVSRVPEVGQKSAFSCQCCFPDAFFCTNCFCASLNNVFRVLCSFWSSNVVSCEKKRKNPVFVRSTIQVFCSWRRYAWREVRMDRGRTHTSVLLEMFKECECDRRWTGGIQHPPHPHAANKTLEPVLWNMLRPPLGCTSARIVTPCLPLGVRLLRRSSATCHRGLIYNAGVLLGPFQTMKLSVIFTPKGNLNIWSSVLMAGAFHHIVHNLDCYLGRVAGRVFTLGSAWVISTLFAILVSSDLRLSSWTMAAVYTLWTKILFILQKRCIL